jgi:hypothetical protein
MASSLWRLASRSSLSLTAAYLSQTKLSALCDAEAKIQREEASLQSDTEQLKEGMRPKLTGDYHGMFPIRQLWHPKLPYPLWDSNWDGKEPQPTGDKEEDRRRMKEIRSTGVTRHIILIRHGQYDETYKVSTQLE